MTDRPTKAELLALADRHRLALAMGNADPGFHLSNQDMEVIEWALRSAAEGKPPSEQSGDG